MATKNQQRIENAYYSHRREIAKHLAKIETGLKEHAKDSDRHWGHVGDLEHVAAELKEISDWINNEGEYAPENIA